MATQPKARNRSIPGWYWPLCLLLSALFMGLLYLVDQDSDFRPTDRVERVRWLVSDSLTAPTRDDSWSSWVSLPHYVSTHPDRASVWYEVDLSSFALDAGGEGPAPAGDSDEPWALYVPEPRGNITLFLGDFMVGEGGPRLPPVAQHTGPLKFTIPTLLNAELAAAIRENAAAPRLYVHRTQMDGDGSLRQVYLGPETLFSADYERLRVLHFWIPLAILVSTLLLSVIMIVLFLLRRREPVYGWYAVMMVFWAIYQFWNVTYLPLTESAFIWRAISYASLGLFVIAAVFFVHRFLDRRPVVLERLLKAWCVIGVCALFGLAAAGSTLYYKFGLYVWIPVANALGLYVLLRLGRDTYAAPSNERLYLLAVASVVVIAGLRDFVWDLGIGLPGTTYYVGYSAGLVLLVFAVILMMRFSHALDEADDLNEHLSDLVSEKTQQLEHNYEKLRRIEKDVVVSEERKRIMRDMHDGLGGQLVHALALSEQGSDEDLQKALRYAMDDLRLVVDSLSPDNSSLFELLANYRHRVSQLTNRIQIDTTWHIDESVGNLDLDPKKALNILRILQEGVTNAIRHADCRQIDVSFTEADGHLIVRISDDGHGLEARSQGRGLKNMRVRAREIGANLDIDFSAAGTAVTCRLPALLQDG